MFSFDECVPKRPPRPQKLPLASGTVQVDDAERLRLDGDVDDPHHLPVLEALVGERLADNSDEVASCLRSLRLRIVVIVLDAGGRGRAWPQFLICEFRQHHAEQRKRRVRAGVRREIEPGDLRIHQIRVGGILRSVQQLVAIDDLHDAVAAGAVAEVDAIALRSRRDRAVQIGRHRTGRAGLLSRQAEVADEHRLRGIAQVVDLRHAAACASRARR